MEFGPYLLVDKAVNNGALEKSRSFREVLRIGGFNAYAFGALIAALSVVGIAAIVTGGTLFPGLLALPFLAFMAAQGYNLAVTPFRDPRFGLQR